MPGVGGVGVSGAGLVDPRYLGGVSAAGVSTGVSDAPAATGPLELISAPARAACVGAYSFRRLTSSYAGALVRLRRSSDSAEQDFGLGQDAVDTAEVTTWLGGSNGFIVRMYAQVGATNLEQATAANQPAYLASSIGSKPAADFNGTAHYLTANGLAATFSGSDKPLSAHIIAHHDAYSGSRTLFGLGRASTSTPTFHFLTNANALSASKRDDANGLSVSSSAVVFANSSHSHEIRHTGISVTWATTKQVVDGINAAAQDRGATTIDLVTVGALARSTIANYFDGKISEVVLFSADIGAADMGVLSDQAKAYYSLTTLGILPFVSVQEFPDAAGGDVGTGFTCTGLARDDETSAWWVGNHGRPTPGSVAAWAPSLVKVSLNGATKLDEILIAPLFPAAQSIQGVAVDTTDHTLWFASQAEGLVRHISKAGASIGSFSIVNVNGLCYDSSRDCLWLTVGNTIYRYTKAGSLVDSAALGISDVDHLHYEAASDTIWVSQGANSSTGQVYSYNPTTKAVGATIYRITSATAIEGVHVAGSDVYITHDGYFHSAAPLENQLRRYSRVAP